MSIVDFFSSPFLLIQALIRHGRACRSHRAVMRLFCKGKANELDLRLAGQWLSIEADNVNRIGFVGLGMTLAYGALALFLSWWLLRRCGL